MITQDSCKKMHDRLQEPCMITQDSFIRFMHENVPKSCTHMHDLTQVSCMNLAKIHNMIMQEIFAWGRSGRVVMVPLIPSVPLERARAASRGRLGVNRLGFAFGMATDLSAARP